MAVWTLAVSAMILSLFLANSQDIASEGCEFGIAQNGNLQLYLNLSYPETPKSPDVHKCQDPPPRTCKDVKAVESRTVVILSDGLEVLCDTQTDGGGWIVFQRRLSGDVDFYRNWTDYKYGFGNIRGNFWLGNEHIHRLTVLRRYQLRVDFTFNERNYFAVYSSFRILGETEMYRLEVEGYSGNARDSLTYHNGMAFTTRDRDNDLRGTTNCAVQFHGAWWYNNCLYSNLNGLWGSRKDGEGLDWATRTGHNNSATFTEMKIRPVD